MGWDARAACFAKLPHEFLDPKLVKILLVPGRISPLIGQIDFQAGIEEGQFARAPSFETKLVAS
jgi:hypothetical protein